MIRIVEASQKHAGVLVELGKVTFAETFLGIGYYTQEILDGYLQNAFVLEVIAEEMKDKKLKYFLVEVEGVFAGYAKVHEKEPPECLHGQHTICVDRFYFLKAFHNRGLGSLLLERVFSEARNRGYSKVWLSVWEYNRQALAFYRKKGFERVGDWDWPFESNGLKYVDRDWIFAVDLPIASTP